jgi:regulator-associated protein of mTOR
MGAPSIYVYDCSNAGIIIESFAHFARQHENEYEQAVTQSRQNAVVPPLPSYKSCIQLAACGAKEFLPMNPDLPADLFTSCLTTPIKVALRWFILKSTSKLVPKVTLDMIEE